jgi:hypothetical protein
MEKREQNKNYLNELIKEKDDLIHIIKEAKKQFIKDDSNEEVLDNIDKEINFINNLTQMVIKNKDDEIKLNNSLLFFIDEYKERAEKIVKLIEEELQRIKFLNK